MIAFIIWSIVAVLLAIVGIYSRHSKKTVSFFSNVKPPEVSDVKRYNTAVSKIWFVYAVLFEVLGIPLLFLEQNDPLIFVVILGCVFLTIGIMIAYSRVESIYRKKK